MVNHHPATFGGHRHCGSGDIMLLVAEEENSRCSCFNPPLLFISKGHGLKAHGISYILVTRAPSGIVEKFENNFCQSV